FAVVTQEEIRRSFRVPPCNQDVEVSVVIKIHEGSRHCSVREWRESSLGGCVGEPPTAVIVIKPKAGVGQEKNVRLSVVVIVSGDRGGRVWGRKQSARVGHVFEIPKLVVKDSKTAAEYGQAVEA